jgi:PTS system mannose-specific IIB component
MAIVWTRIDDRLIHGQVATYWLRHINADQVICVNDDAAANPVQAQVLKMAAPDLSVHLFPVQKFIHIYQNQPIRKSTFLILGSTSDALALKKGGVPMDYINFGGMRAKEGRVMYHHDLCFTPQEEQDLYELINSGTKIDYQIDAHGEAEDILKVLEKAKAEKS